MKQLIKTKGIIFCLVFTIFYFSCSEEPSLKYPVSKKVDQVDDYHGTKVKDPYHLPLPHQGE